MILKKAGPSPPSFRLIVQKLGRLGPEDSDFGLSERQLEEVARHWRSQAKHGEATWRVWRVARNESDTTGLALQLSSLRCRTHLSFQEPESLSWVVGWRLAGRRCWRSRRRFVRCRRSHCQFLLRGRQFLEDAAGVELEPGEPKFPPSLVQKTSSPTGRHRNPRPNLASCSFPPVRILAFCTGCRLDVVLIAAATRFPLVKVPPCARPSLQCRKMDAWRMTSLLGARTLLGAPGIAARNNDATRASWHRY